MSETFDFIVVGADPPGRSSRPVSPKTRPAAWRSSRRASVPRKWRCFALHFSITVYHLTSTCRIGSVVDPRLWVVGVGKLRVADASVMPNVVSGNTNAAAVMIGEKAAETVAADHGVKLAEFAGEQPASRR